MLRFRLLAAVLLFCSAARAGGEPARANPELQRIQADIRAQNLPWTAGETVRSQLTPEQRRANLIPVEQLQAHLAEIDRTLVVSEPSARRVAALPSRFSWRDRCGHRFVSGVRNQGECGSCMAFGFLGAVETLALWRLGKPFQSGSNDFDMSEQELVDCARGDDFQGCEGGSSWRPLYQYLEGQGISTERCYPYEARNMTCRSGPCEEKVYGEGHAYIASYTPSADWEIEAFKLELYQRPIASYMVVYNDLHYYTDGVYIPTIGAEIEGGHAVVVVGWDDELRAWEIKNSWGPKWARDGHFFVRWGKSYAGAGGMRLEYMEDAPPAEFCDLPESLEFDGAKLDRYRMLRLQNCGGSGIEWKISSDVDWLQFSQTEGLAVVEPADDIRIDPVDPPRSGGQGTVTITATWPSYFERDDTIRTEEYSIPVSISATSSGGGGGGSGGCSASEPAPSRASASARGFGVTGSAALLLLLVALRVRRRG